MKEVTRRQMVWRLDVVTPALLHLNQSPPSRLGVVDVLGGSGDANGVRHELDLVLHSCSQLVGLGVSVDVDLLCPTGDDEDRDLTGFQHASFQNVHMPDVEDAAVGFHAHLEVLFR